MRELITLLLISNAFSVSSFQIKSSFSRSSVLHSSWQEDLDKVLDVDTPCDSRREFTRDLVGKIREVSNDVASALQDQDIERIAPRNLTYGKSVMGLQAFRKQLFSDIIPDLLTKGIPTVLEEGPKFANKLAEMGPNGIIEQGQKALEAVRDISQDPMAVEDIRREIKNIVRSTPEGLETPFYETIETREFFIIRKYDRYSVCSIPMASNEFEPSTSMEPVAVSKGFNALARYIFGRNTNDLGDSEKMSMTTPVIIDDNSMKFVLPNQYTSQTAPLPLSDDISLFDVAAQFVAVREFQGVATEGEVNRQRAKLEDALLSAGITYEPNTFQVLQYNPPYTVPWVRRNEVSFRIKYDAVVKPVEEENIADAEIVGTATGAGPVSETSTEKDDGGDNEATAQYFSSPEAGD